MIINKMNFTDGSYSSVLVYDTLDEDLCENVTNR